MTMLPVSMDPAVSADGTTLLTQETEARYTVPASFRRSKVLLMMMATGYMGLAESSMGSMMANDTPDEVWWLALGVLFVPLVYLIITLLAVTAANSNLDSIAAARNLASSTKHSTGTLLSSWSSFHPRRTRSSSASSTRPSTTTRSSPTFASAPSRASARASGRKGAGYVGELMLVCAPLTACPNPQSSFLGN